MPARSGSGAARFPAASPVRTGGSAASCRQSDAGALAFGPARLSLGSLHGMTPGNPFPMTPAGQPTASGIHAHSIIPGLGDGPLETRGDGMVRCAGAHLDHVESGPVVRSGHSVQSNPAAIEEVRRIPPRQLAGPCPRGECRPPAGIRGQVALTTVR
ncbi:hypothetical protein M0638_09425 [Roseomonas sp. NAR14]|uniref:Uncharacterized protein n=1 Tax=Roseomonas acroporae TaxID=2937791 RepID=A0A9X2BV17_9PROT|nr:hypothetical protein [Roseomonas acroporae]MCK8784601.1 hypothetical protein [Roseomonas acroporae]